MNDQENLPVFSTATGKVRVFVATDAELKPAGFALFLGNSETPLSLHRQVDNCALAIKNLLGDAIPTSQLNNLKVEFPQTPHIAIDVVHRTIQNYEPVVDPLTRKAIARMLNIYTQQVWAYMPRGMILAHLYKKHESYWVRIGTEGSRAWVGCLGEKVTSLNNVRFIGGTIENLLRLLLRGMSMKECLDMGGRPVWVEVRFPYLEVDFKPPDEELLYSEGIDVITAGATKVQFRGARSED